MKELYLQAHENLIENYLQRHPNSTWDEAYSRTADGTYDAMQDRLADMADFEKTRRKEGGINAGSQS